jgi:hypothetical protein
LTASKQTRRYDLSISKERKSGGACQLIGISILPKKCVFSQRSALFTWADDRSDKIVFSVRQGQPILTVGTSMAVTITHVFLWGSSATNHIGNALMGSPWRAVDGKANTNA